VHGVFVPVAGSTSVATLPFSVVTRYHTRSSGSQLPRTPDRYTSGVTL
jgi:hypothetical protein